MVKFFKIGYVKSPHGIKGDLRVKFFKKCLSAAGDALCFESKEKSVGPCELMKISEHSGDWIIRVAGCDNRDKAEGLKGYSIGVSKQYLGKDTYLIDVIVGC